jgi:predicted O-methyltransferase YrrM
MRRVKRLLRPLAVLAGLRPPDYKTRVHHGEVCMDNIEIAGLVRAVQTLDRAPETIVEIGSYCGGSTVVIADAARRRRAGVRVYAIEPFVADGDRYQYSYEPLFDANVAEWKLDGTIVKVREMSGQAALGWTRAIDFLYVDGDHGYDAVVGDIKHFVPFVRPGGLFAFHDYKPVGKEGVRRAVDELVTPHYERVFLAGSLICFRKPVEGPR